MSVPLLIGLRYSGTRASNQLVAFLSRVSMLGLIVGVALLLAVLSIMNGFDRELRERILGLVPQAAIFQKGGILDWRAMQHQVEEEPGVLAAAPFIRLNGLVAYQQKAEPVMVFGIDPEQERRVSLIEEFVPLESFNQASNIVLGQAIANKLKVQMGDEITIVVPDADNHSSPKIQYFKVVKILSTQTELDNTLVLMRLESAAALSPTPDRVSGMRLKVEDLFAARDIVWDILLKKGLGFYGSSWMNTHGNLYHAIHMSKKLVALLMSLIVAIAAFNVISTLVMVVTEKQADIAILRTLGASTRSIMKIFMVQGIAIGTVGTALGIVCGIGLALFIENLVRWVEALLGVQFLRSDVYPLTYLPTEIMLSDVLLVAGIALSMTFLATLYPAWRASKILPAEVLRYE